MMVGLVNVDDLMARVFDDLTFETLFNLNEADYSELLVKKIVQLTMLDDSKNLFVGGSNPTKKLCLYFVFVFCKKCTDF